MFAHRNHSDHDLAVLAIHDDDDTWHGTFLQETISHLASREDQDAVAVRTLIVHAHGLGR